MNRRSFLSLLALALPAAAVAARRPRLPPVTLPPILPAPVLQPPMVADQVVYIRDIQAEIAKLEVVIFENMRLAGEQRIFLMTDRT